MVWVSKKIWEEILKRNEIVRNGIEFNKTSTACIDIISGEVLEQTTPWEGESGVRGLTI